MCAICAIYLRDVWAFGPPNFFDITLWVWNIPNTLGISLKSLCVVRVELLHGPSLKLGLKLAA